MTVGCIANMTWIHQWMDAWMPSIMIDQRPARLTSPHTHYTCSAESTRPSSDSSAIFDALHELRGTELID